LCTRRRTQGANLPSLSRALVACAWFGIQTFIGGSSLHEMLLAAGGGGGAALGLPAQPLAALGGITGAQLACFLAFWALQVAIVVRGIDTIKAVETCSAPILVALSAALLLWALGAAGGWGPMLAAPSQVCACVCVCGGVRVCVCVCVCACASCGTAACKVAPTQLMPRTPAPACAQTPHDAHARTTVTCTCDLRKLHSLRRAWPKRAACGLLCCRL
jgi:cytosine/uracil/thiamine/allantoin permease